MGSVDPAGLELTMVICGFQTCRIPSFLAAASTNISCCAQLSYPFLSRIIYFILGVFVCLHVCVPCASNACRGQQRPWNPRKWRSRWLSIATEMLRTELASSRGALCLLHPSATPLPLSCLLFLPFILFIHVYRTAHHISVSFICSAF